MRIWCEACQGSGGILKTSLQDYDGCFFECHDCGGKGYTENETIEYEARVGRAIAKAESNGLLGFNVSDVVNWAEMEGE